MSSILRGITLAALLSSASAVWSASPAFELEGASGVEYTGAAPMLESGNQVVHWFLEQSNVEFPRGDSDGMRVDSWLIFYNPVEGRQLISGTITFSQPIVGLFATQQGLVDSESYGKSGVGYDYSLKFVGLERGDREQTSFAGGTLTIGEWASGEPGDYIRVLTMTAVPEPASIGLMLLGLAGVGAVARRRKA